MPQEDLPDIEQSLDDLLLCGDLDDEQHELIERCIDQGYLRLEEPEKAQVRRLLNQHGSGAQSLARPGRSALQHWRERRQQAGRLTQTSARAKAPAGASKRN